MLVSITVFWQPTCVWVRHTCSLPKIYSQCIIYHVMNAPGAQAFPVLIKFIFLPVQLKCIRIACKRGLKHSITTVDDCTYTCTK